MTVLTAMTVVPGKNPFIPIFLPTMIYCRNRKKESKVNDSDSVIAVRVLEPNRSNGMATVEDVDGH